MKLRQVRTHFKTVHLGIKRQDRKNLGIKRQERKNTCKIDACQSFGLSTCVELDKHSLLLCKQCQFSTIRNEDMRGHIQRFHEGIIYTCEQCGFVTKWKQMLRNHMKSKHTTRSLQCMEENCSFSTYSDKILRNHIEVKHEGRVRYKCENMNCEFGTNHKKNLKDHSFIHTGEKTHKCNHCNYTSYHEGNFKEHVKTHNKGKSTNVVSITLPRKRLKSNFSTNRGEKTNKCNSREKFHKSSTPNGENNRKVINDIFIEAITSLKSKHLNKEEIPQEEEKKKKKCPNCDKVFKTNTGLRLHLKQHSGESLFNCLVCDFKTPQKLNLVKHTSSKHGQDVDGKLLDMNFACEICDFKSIAGHMLKNHMLRKHTQRAAMKFHCIHCIYASVEKAALEKHMRFKHTKERPFICDICRFNTHTSSALARHKRSHSNTKPHKCEVCGIEYADSKRLREHMYIHTGHKPFKCELCNYTSRRKDNLNAHIRNQHSEHAGEI